MVYVDFILNLAGLLLWLNWRSVGFDPLSKRRPATLMGTLRPASPKKIQRWHLLLFITSLLLLRTIFYWQIGSATGGKTYYLDFGATAQGFRHDIFWQSLAFSFFSFGRALGIFYLSLLLLSILSGPEPIHRLIKIPLGRMDGWPRWVKIILPLFATALFWWLASWIFSKLPPQLPCSLPHRFQAAFVIGLESYLIWKFPAVALLGLHLLNSYIYFGKHSFWNYVNATAQKILSPLKKIPLQLGRMDFAPVLGIALIFLAGEFSERGLIWLYQRLPF